MKLDLVTKRLIHGQTSDEWCYHLLAIIGGEISMVEYSAALVLEEIESSIFSRDLVDISIIYKY